MSRQNKETFPEPAYEFFRDDSFHENAAPHPIRFYVVSASILAMTALCLSGFGEMCLIASCGLFALIMLAPFLSWMLMLLLVMLLGCSDLMSDMPVIIAGVKVYGADGILYFFLLAFGWSIYRASKYDWCIKDMRTDEWRLFIMICIAFMYGIISLFKGMSNGHAPNDALGDFRRHYIYPLALLTPLFLPAPKRMTSALTMALLAAGFLIGVVAIHRLWTGQSWHEAYYVFSERGFTPQKRLISYTDVASLGLILACLIAFTWSSHNKIIVKLMCICLIIPSIGLLALSGWRIGIIYILSAPVITICLVTYSQGRRWTILVRSAFLAGLLGAVSAAVLLFIMPELASKTFSILLLRNSEIGVSEDARIYAWRYAVGHFVQHPILGIGLGDQPYFMTKGTDGTFMGFRATVHSMYIAILYLTGLVGFSLFAAIHGFFIRTMFRRLRHVPPERQALLCGICSGYLCIMAVNAIQPLQTGGIVALYLLMGFAILLCRPQPTVLTETV